MEAYVMVANTKEEKLSVGRGGKERKQRASCAACVLLTMIHDNGASL